jgi:sorbitol/mannitol transport system substrate-binding protein
MTFKAFMLGVCSALAFASLAQAGETLTIATVNNGDMIRMQKLTDDFTAANPDIALEWVTMEENALRQKVTTDIATKGGQYDVMTIGTYEVPIWAKQGWLVPLENLTTSCRQSARACPSTASSTRRRSTARAR